LRAAAMPAVFVAGRCFGIPATAVVRLVVLLALLVGTMALWAFANRRVDGSEWWQDDSASGWRGR
jgi:hypothetical protein